MAYISGQSPRNGASGLVDWHDLAACQPQFGQTYKRCEWQIPCKTAPAGGFLPPFEGHNPLTMIKETLPAGSFQGAKSIRLTPWQWDDVAALGGPPRRGSGGDLEGFTRARGRGRR